jgi:hypothetical protein
LFKQNSDFKIISQRPVFNMSSPPAPEGWIFPLGVNLTPRGKVCPLGEMFTCSFTLWTLTTVWKNGGANREFHNQGITSPLGDKVHPCPVEFL